MHPGRMLGGVLGLGVLVSAFFLPFWNLTAGQPAAFDTLYTAFRYVLSNLPAIQGLGSGPATYLAIVMILAGAMVIAAGVFGVFPRGAGVLGVLAMVGLTFGPILFLLNYAFDPANYGAGFWSLWALSVLMLFAASWTRRGERRARQVALVPPTNPAPLPTAAA